MSSSGLLTRFRIEDVLCALIVLSLLILSGVGLPVRSLKLDEERFWAISFILFPMSLIIFLASLQYAIGGGSTRFQRTIRDILGIIRDWMPFLFFLLFYETFQATIWVLVSPEIRDAFLLNVDRLMFGETPAVWMQRLASELLTNLMAVFYFLHLVLPPLLAAVWYRRDLRTFRHLLLSIMVAAAIGSAGYATVPAVGPGVAYPELFEVNLQGSFYRPLTEWLDKARAPRDVFPSLHVGLSSIVLYFGARRGKIYFAILLPLVLGNWISTMYLRYHYFIDVVAGWITAALAIWISGNLLRLEERLGRARTPIPAQPAPAPPGRTP